MRHMTKINNARAAESTVLNLLRQRKPQPWKLQPRPQS